jgi:hypothetical protein
VGEALEVVVGEALVVDAVAGVVGDGGDGAGVGVVVGGVPVVAVEVVGGGEQVRPG